METAGNTSLSGIGKATAKSVEDPTGHRRTSSAQIMEPPEEAGGSVAEAGVETVTPLPKNVEVSNGPPGKRQRVEVEKEEG